MLWFGTVDISIIARRMTLKPEEEERLDMDQAEQIIKEAVASLGRGLDQVLQILPSCCFNSFNVQALLNSKTDFPWHSSTQTVLAQSCSSTLHQWTSRPVVPPK